MYIRLFSSIQWTDFFFSVSVDISADIYSDTRLCILVSNAGCTCLHPFIHLLNQFINVFAFLTTEPKSEENKHDTADTKNTSYKDIQKGDFSSTSEAETCHNAVENCLAHRVIHEVKPDAGALQIAFNTDYCNCKDVNVQCKTESSKRMEIVCTQKPNGSLQHHKSGHQELDYFSEQVDVINLGRFNIVYETLSFLLSCLLLLGLLIGWSGCWRGGISWHFKNI